MASASVFILIGVALAVVITVLARRRVGFLAQRPEHYEGQGPAFDLRRHLDGDMICEGVIYGPTGRVTTRFVADMRGVWDGDRGRITEKFRFDGGGTLDREWTIRLTGEGRFEATAPDIVGTGRGWQAGSAARLRYAIRLPDSAGGHVLNATDWLYLLENGTILNRSRMCKFGVPLGELVATIRKAA